MKEIFNDKFSSPEFVDYLYPFKIFADLKQKLENPDQFEFHLFKAELVKYISIYYGFQIHQETLLGHDSLKSLLTDEDELIERFFEDTNKYPHFYYLKSIYSNLEHNNFSEAKTQLELSKIKELEKKIISKSDTIRTWRFEFVVDGKVKNIKIAGDTAKGTYSFTIDDKKSEDFSFEKTDFYDQLLAILEVSEQNKAAAKSKLKLVLPQIAAAQGALKASSSLVTSISLALLSDDGPLAGAKLEEQVYKMDLDVSQNMVVVSQPVTIKVSDTGLECKNNIILTHTIQVPDSYNSLSGNILPLDHQIKCQYNEEALKEAPEVQNILNKLFKAERKRAGFVAVFNGSIVTEKEAEIEYPLLLVSKVRQEIHDGTYKFENFQHELAEYIRVKKNIADKFSSNVNLVRDDDEQIINEYFAKSNDSFRKYLGEVYQLLKSNDTTSLPAEPNLKKLVEDNIQGEIFRGITLNVIDKNGQYKKLHIKGPDTAGGAYKLFLNDLQLQPISAKDFISELSKILGTPENQTLFILHKLSQKDGLTKTSSDFGQKLIADSNGKFAALEGTPNYTIDLKENNIRVSADWNLQTFSDLPSRAYNAFRYIQEIDLPSEEDLKKNFFQEKTTQRTQIHVDKAELQRFGDITGYQSIIDQAFSSESCKDFVKQCHELNEKYKTHEAGQSLVFDCFVSQDAHESKFYALNIILDAQDRIAQGEFNFEEFKHEIIEHYRKKVFLEQRYYGENDLEGKSDDEVIAYFKGLKKERAGYDFDKELLKLYEHLEAGNSASEYDFSNIGQDFIVSNQFRGDLSRTVPKVPIDLIDKDGKVHKIQFYDTDLTSFKIDFDGKEYNFKNQKELLGHIITISGQLGVDHRDILYVVRELSLQSQAVNEPSILESFHLIKQEYFSVSARSTRTAAIDLRDNSLAINHNISLKKPDETKIDNAITFKSKFFYPTYDHNNKEILPRVRDTKKQVTVYACDELKKAGVADMLVSQYSPSANPKQDVSVQPVAVQSQDEPVKASFVSRLLKAIYQYIILPIIKFFQYVVSAIAGVFTKMFSKKVLDADTAPTAPKDLSQEVEAAQARQQSAEVKKELQTVNPLQVNASISDENSLLQKCRDAESLSVFGEAIETAKKAKVVSELIPERNFATEFRDQQTYFFKGETGTVQYVFEKSNNGFKSVKYYIEQGFSGLIPPQLLHVKDDGVQVFSEGFEVRGKERFALKVNANQENKEFIKCEAFIEPSQTKFVDAVTQQNKGSISRGEH